MKLIVTVLVAGLLFVACVYHDEPNSQKDQMPQSTVKPKYANTLTGVVIRKDWTKSMESWNAGGSEYYVLQLKDNDLPPHRQTAKEGVILCPSEAIPFEHFANLVGQTVICGGEFVAGKPYIPSQDSMEQMPSPIPNPFTGKTNDPIAGSGFKVHVIMPVEK